MDYGIGNVLAFCNIYKRFNINFCIARKIDDLKSANKLIFPGVGSFDHAMECFDGSGLRPKVEELVLEDNIPILGICVGMQMMANSSEEGKMPGLGWVPGCVKHFPREESNFLPLPHMGWNKIKSQSSSLFSGMVSEPEFYFLHSYFFKCHHNINITAKAFYGTDFACAVNKNNIYGVQFHPEKSHQNGEKLLKNFATM